jgi:hypothetical protein
MKDALKLAYLGDNYYGFQKHPDLVTVDSVVRKELAQIGVIHGDFCYAGRTDRGVSALGHPAAGQALGSMARWDLGCGWECATFAGRSGWDCHSAGNRQRLGQISG